MNNLIFKTNIRVIEKCIKRMKERYHFDYYDAVAQRLLDDNKKWQERKCNG